jgi:lipopolysaccharide assembly LptE-like protein
VKQFLSAALIAFGLTGCMGYHIGPAKPYYLRDVRSISVPTFKNSTLQPRIEVLVTGTVIKQFQQDGTFRIVGDGEADATLKGEITAISRRPTRSVRGNVLATTEFGLTMTVRYSVLDRRGKQIAPASSAAGTTSFFVGRDVNTDERQALPLATEQLAAHLVSQLSEGW